MTDTLPVVAWLHELTTETYREASITSFSETDPWVDALKDVGHAVQSRPLTVHALAQAAADERDRLSRALEIARGVIKNLFDASQQLLEENIALKAEAEALRKDAERWRDYHARALRGQARRGVRDQGQRDDGGSAP